MKKKEKKRENFIAAQPNRREIEGDIVEPRNAIRSNFLCLFSQESADNTSASAHVRLFSDEIFNKHCARKNSSTLARAFRPRVLYIENVS